MKILSKFSHTQKDDIYYNSEYSSLIILQCNQGLKMEVYPPQPDIF